MQHGSCCMAFIQCVASNFYHTLIRSLVSIPSDMKGLKQEKGKNIYSI